MQVMLDGYYPRRLHVCIEGINFARFIAFYVAFISPQHYLYISGNREEIKLRAHVRRLTIYRYTRVYRDTILTLHISFPDSRRIFELESPSIVQDAPRIGQEESCVRSTRDRSAHNYRETNCKCEVSHSSRIA